MSVLGEQRWADLLRAWLLRAVYALLALPLGIVFLGLSLAGRHPVAVSLQRRVLRTLLGVQTGQPTTGQLVTHSLLTLPVNAACFVPSAYLWWLLPFNLGYPLRPSTTPESLQNAWGGPSLIGAWFVHSLGAVLFFVVIGVPLMAGLAWLQGWIARRLLNAPRPADVH